MKLRHLIIMILFLLPGKVYANEITLKQGENGFGKWEDVGLLADTMVYNTSGGYESVIALNGDSSTSVKSKKTRILVRIGLEDFEKYDITSDGILTYKISEAKTSGSVTLYPVNSLDSSWKSAEWENLGEKAAGYACGAQLARDSDSRGGRLGYYSNRKDDGISWSGGIMLGKNESFSSLPIVVSEYNVGDTEICFVIPKDYIIEWKNGNNPGFVMCLTNENEGTIIFHSANASKENRPEFIFNCVENVFQVTNCLVSDTVQGINKIYTGMKGLDILATVHNSSIHEKECICIFAIYSENGRLKGVLSDKTMIEAQKEHTFNMSFGTEIADNIVDGDILKIYFWNEENIMPYTMPSIVDYNVGNISANDFSGISVYMSETELGCKWGRMDFGWGEAEPNKGKFNEKVIQGWKDDVLLAKQNGVTILPILDYSTDWAADKSAYSYTYRNIKYEYSEATSYNNGWYRDVTVTDLNTGISNTNFNVARTASLEPFSNPEDWKDYVKKIVSEFSKEPYNLEYFQIWNEANPISGFFYGDMIWYMENIHKPAAKIIHEYGCKVVYGGWPSCASYNELYDLLDATDAWNTIDVFDLHYFNTSDMINVYNKALSRGIKAPSVWQTEIGFTQDFLFIPRTYPSALNEMLKYRSENSDQFKLFYFTLWAPDDPQAYGYNRCLYAGDRLSKHGKAYQTFLNTLNGKNIERYTAVKVNKDLSIYGFLTDNNKIVVNISGDAKGSEISFDGIINPKSVKILDCYGERESTIKYEMSEYKMSVKIPDDYADTLFYIIVEAEYIIPTKNNILDFEYGSSIKDNRSIIAPGRWSYLNENFGQLEKGTSYGVFNTEEWAKDNINKQQHAWCLDSQGRVFTDNLSVSYNFTVDEKRAEKDMVINLDFSANGYTRALNVWKTNDNNVHLVGEEKELLNSIKTERDEKLELLIPAEELSEGNDIIFEVYSVQGEYWMIPSEIKIDIGI